MRTRCRPGDWAEADSSTSGARTGTGDLGIMKPTLGVRLDRRKGYHGNDLGAFPPIPPGRSAAECAASLAIEGWILACPAPLPPELHAQIAAMIQALATPSQGNADPR